MHLTVSHDFLPKRNSTRAAIVMDHFGIGFEQGRHFIAEGLELPIHPGDVVLFTGASGSGKSSLLRAASDQLQAHTTSPTLNPGLSTLDPLNSQLSTLSSLDSGLSTLHPQRSTLNAQRQTLLNIDGLDLGDDLLIDRLPLPVEESMRLLSACGLGEAPLLLRTPGELSDGQRYRFRLALGLSRRPQWLVADEFTATLDRTLARVIAFNIRRLADRTGTGFLLATTHEDVAEDLSPDLHVRCRLDGEIMIARNDKSPVRNDESRRKKKRSPSPATCGSAKRPSPTGRTSLGGIIEVSMSGSRGS
jgi:ABC-type ATPase with predicted acetyltransferase domain